MEVVRDKEKRRALPGHACPECEPFLQAVAGTISREQALQHCSRHRAKWRPYETPEGFWDLSFADSKKASQEEAGQDDPDAF